MGAWLTVEALRQLRLARNDAAINRLNVILAAPDIDVDVFRSQMEVIDHYQDRDILFYLRPNLECRHAREQR